MKLLIAKGANVGRRRRSSTIAAVERLDRPRQRAIARSAAATGCVGSGPPAGGRSGAAVRAPRGRCGRRCAARGRLERRGAAAAAAGGRGRRRAIRTAPDMPCRGAAAAARGPSDNELIGTQGGLTALHFAAREGYADAATRCSTPARTSTSAADGDHSTPLLVATHQRPLRPRDDAARARRRSEPAERRRRDAALCGAQHRVGAAHVVSAADRGAQQKTSYLDADEGAAQGRRRSERAQLTQIWYAAYNSDRMGVDFAGATPFWRAAYALDVDAMKLLVEYGADPNIPTMSFGAAEAAERSVRPASGARRRPAVPPFHAAAASATAARASRSASLRAGRRMPAAKYLVEELGGRQHARRRRQHRAAPRRRARRQRDDPCISSSRAPTSWR